MNFPGLTDIVQYGPPPSLDSLVQRMGRGGRELDKRIQAVVMIDTSQLPRPPVNTRKRKYPPGVLAGSKKKTLLPPKKEEDTGLAVVKQEEDVIMLDVFADGTESQPRSSGQMDRESSEDEEEDGGDEEDTESDGDPRAALGPITPIASFFTSFR